LSFHQPAALRTSQDRLSSLQPPTLTPPSSVFLHNNNNNNKSNCCWSKMNPDPSSFGEKSAAVAQETTPTRLAFLDPAKLN
ncbi:unnamed protein product, partial [Ascophyllum nodosum]